MIQNGETISRNRSASFDYFIEDKLEVGLVLTGSEVKSLRNGRANIDDAYVGTGEGGLLYLYNVHISEYKFSSRFGHTPRRPRAVLLHKRERNKILGKVKMAGYSIIPISLYFTKRGLVKMNIGLAKGKKLVDKRQTIKEREWNRNKARILKNNGY